MPATSTPNAMATITPSGCTETNRPIRNGCSTCASTCCTRTTTPNMSNAVNGPCATSATSTATVPETNAPIIGTKAPRKTSTPIAPTKGTPRTAAPIMMPIASVAATSTVARTNWVSDCHATRPEESARRRPARGNRRTSQAQILAPSARKKYVENSTMNRPATTWPTAVPTSATLPTASSPSAEICSWAVSSPSLIWESVTFNGPVRSQSRIWAIPSVTCLDRSPMPDRTWLLTKATISTIAPIRPRTTSIAASWRGRPRFISQVTTGPTSAAMSRATVNGSTTTTKKFNSHRIASPAIAITMNRHAHAAARSTP